MDSRKAPVSRRQVFEVVVAILLAVASMPGARGEVEAPPVAGPVLFVVGNAGPGAMAAARALPPGAPSAEVVEAALAGRVKAAPRRVGGVVVFPGKAVLASSTGYVRGANLESGNNGYLALLDAISTMIGPGGGAHAISFPWQDLSDSQRKAAEAIFALNPGSTPDGVSLANLWNDPAQFKFFRLYVAFQATVQVIRGQDDCGTRIAECPDPWHFQRRPADPVPWASAREMAAAFEPGGNWMPVCAPQNNLRLLAPLSAVPVDLKRMEAGGRGAAATRHVRSLVDWATEVSRATRVAIEVDARLRDHPILLAPAGAAGKPVEAADLLEALRVAADPGSAWRWIGKTLFLSARSPQQRGSDDLILRGAGSNRKMADAAFRLFGPQFKALGLSEEMFTGNSRPLSDWPAPVQRFVHRLVEGEDQKLSSTRELLAIWDAADPPVAFCVFAEVDLQYKDRYRMSTPDGAAYLSVGDRYFDQTAVGDQRPVPIFDNGAIFGPVQFDRLGPYGPPPASDGIPADPFEKEGPPPAMGVLSGGPR